MEKSEVSYYCSLCQSNRYVDLKGRKFEERIAESPNGLIEISDIHKCRDGFLSINKIHVDHNLAVRSFSMMELAERRKSKKSMKGMPMPGQAKSYNLYRLDKMHPDGGYRLLLLDKSLKVKLNIGAITNSETPIDKISSTSGKVELEYYPSEFDLKPTNQQWFQFLVDILEQLPPTRLSLFVEALQFVLNYNEESPTELLKRQLKILLTSHLVVFEILKPDIFGNTLENLDENQNKIHRQFKDVLDEDPDYTLYEVQMEVQDDINDLLTVVTTVEDEGIVKIITEDPY